MTYIEAMKQHKKFCSCYPRWKQGEFGPELLCSDGSLIWWPQVKVTLDEKQQFTLFCALPMYYGSDGDSVNNMLLRLGYREVNPENFKEVKEKLTKQFEHELWQDNIGKQLLGEGR